MALFLTETEKSRIATERQTDPLRSFYWCMLNRMNRRAATPGLSDASTTTDWWHHASEVLTDAAMIHALSPTAVLGGWLRDVTLEIVRRPLQDWVGPPFRKFDAGDPVGNLETAHLCWSVALVLDLAPELFSDAQRIELEDTLRTKGMDLCQRWLDRNHHMANWRCVMNAGVAVAAAVLHDEAALKTATQECNRCLDVFQPDGSYSESLQYGNYAGSCLVLTREALIRRNPEMETALSMEPWVKKPRWDAASLFYNKPLSGWGSGPRPRSANFNDSAAMYRASADFLLHIAARAAGTHPKEAGLARWLFDKCYTPCVRQEPCDQASFGFINDFGFLTLLLLGKAAEAITPWAAGLKELETFSCGDVLVRDAFEGRTILAVHAAADPLYGPGHLHGDLNSFILVHNQERLLVDPGHSCYRGLVHQMEIRSANHNTCTFSWKAASGNLQLQEETATHLIEQSCQARRQMDRNSHKPLAPVSRGGTRLLAARCGPFTAVASEISELYGKPIEEFTRFWFLCGPHVLFVVDRIRSEEPVTTTWNWLLNNRDGELELKVVPPDRLVARRGNAGMKLFHLGGGRINGPVHGFVHDAYHPLPNQLGEGASGSGQLIRWVEAEACCERQVVHAFVVDDPGGVTGWHLRREGQRITMESPNAGETWTLDQESEQNAFQVHSSAHGKTYRITENEKQWHLTEKD